MMRWILVFIAIAGVLGMIEGYIHARINQGVKSAITANLLKSQNDAIESKALHTQAYIKDAKRQKEKIITKYKTIELKDTTCEAKLKEIENALDLYYRTSPMP